MRPKRTSFASRGCLANIKSQEKHYAPKKEMAWSDKYVYVYIYIYMHIIYIYIRIDIDILGSSNMCKIIAAFSRTMFFDPTASILRLPAVCSGCLAHSRTLA